MRFCSNPSSGDPSDTIQSFEEIDINIHCCRYWWLKRWKHQRLFFPYWRLYWNKRPGAYVYFEKRVNLEPDQIILIPPNTAFYTGIFQDEYVHGEAFCMEGGWIENSELETISIEKGYIPHFYIHFNLGYQFDNLTPGIYTFPRSEKQKQLLSTIISSFFHNRKDFTLDTTMAIYSLILSTVTHIHKDSWQRLTIGVKIQDVLNYINNNLDKNIANEKLAKIAYMTPNSFARIFKLQTKQTIQSYIRKKRIEQSCKLLFHTNNSIEQIADDCGFTDRYHFTKVFVNIMRISPARYRKHFFLNDS